MSADKLDEIAARLASSGEYAPSIVEIRAALDEVVALRLGVPDIWCNAERPTHEIGTGICSCRGAREVRKAIEAGREDRAILDDLKTEAGKAAFALANGWPLPEEMLAARAEIERLLEDNSAMTTTSVRLLERTEAAEVKLAEAQAKVDRLDKIRRGLHETIVDQRCLLTESGNRLAAERAKVAKLVEALILWLGAKVVGCNHYRSAVMPPEGLVQETANLVASAKASE